MECEWSVSGVGGVSGWGKRMNERKGWKTGEEGENRGKWRRRGVTENT